MIFEKLVKPLKNNKTARGGIEPQISVWMAGLLTNRPPNFILERGKNMIILQYFMDSDRVLWHTQTIVLYDLVLLNKGNSL